MIIFSGCNLLVRNMYVYNCAIPPENHVVQLDFIDFLYMVTNSNSRIEYILGLAAYFNISHSIAIYRDVWRRPIELPRKRMLYRVSQINIGKQVYSQPRFLNCFISWVNLKILSTRNIFGHPVHVVSSMWGTGVLNVHIDYRQNKYLLLMLYLLHQTRTKTHITTTAV